MSVNTIVIHCRDFEIFEVACWYDVSDLGDLGLDMGLEMGSDLTARSKYSHRLFSPLI